MIIPKTQKAAVKQGSGNTATVLVQDVPVQEPGPNQILVKINYTGLCASDITLLKSEGGFDMAPTTNGIVGHEGAGTVAAVGSDVQGLWQTGDRAGIKFIASVCRKCEYCTNGKDECHRPNMQASGYTIAGTFQEYVVTDARYATRLPEGVSDEEAGPIMCGGVTALVACKRSGVQPGEWVVISGAGGGLGHFAIQYAKQMGMRVIAIDSGSSKRDLCLSLGAEHFLDFATTTDIPAAVNKITTYGAHATLIFAGSRTSYEQAPHMLRVGGTMVCVALPKDASIIAGASPALLCMKALKVVGSLVGTRRDVDEALQWTARGLVKPILSHGTIEDINGFCEKMEKGDLVGRAVIKIAS